MKTFTVEAVFSASEIATLAGVAVTDVYNLHTEHFGSPGHFRLNGTGATVYTERGARALAEQMDKQGNAVGAHALRVLVEQRVSTPSRDLAQPWWLRD